MPTDNRHSTSSPQSPQRHVRYVAHHSSSRPKRKPVLAIALSAIAVLVVVAVVAVVYTFFLHQNSPKNVSGKQVAFIVKKGASGDEIARELEKAGLIDSPFIFQFHLRTSGESAHIKAGSHRIVAGASYDEVISSLVDFAPVATVKVTIPEGRNIKQIAVILEDKLGIPQAEFVTYAENAAPELTNRFPELTGAYHGSLEGYLFPDTYEFTKKATKEEICATMVARFGQVYQSTKTQAATGKYSINELVTVASLVEREASVASERPLVASVIYNRLDRGMKLQLCSSVQFLLPDPEKNKLRLTNADISTPSPYNTYLHKGLPPGPIANPGKAALDAAMNPEPTDYLYFVLTGKDGSQTFASTDAEFAAAKELSKQVFGQ